MDEHRNRLAVFGAVLIGMIILVLGVKVFMRPTGSLPPASPPPGAAAPAIQTREAAPDNVVVPEVGAATLPDHVAVPQFTTPIKANSDAALRIFTITGDQGKFQPDTFIVRQGDTFTANFTANDQDYDFTQPDYGFKLMIPRGETKLIGFTATAEGKFTFYCAICGGPERGPVGYIIVAKSE